jgi:copper chaperone CopZ
MRYFLLAAVFVPAFASAQEKTPKVERLTYRVTGLFSPEREKDLRSAFQGLADFKLIDVNYADAEITIEFAPAKLFPGQKPERVTELVEEKVRSATNHTFGVKPRRTIPRDKLKEVTIPVAGCDCKACNLATYEAVSGIDGVFQATANLKEGRVTALIDPSKTDQGKLEESLKKRGVAVGKK